MRKRDTRQPARQNQELRSRADHGIRSGGTPLAEPVAAGFGARFGHDFSQVRVHTDAAAHESAQALEAKAYTLGTDIVLGPGVESPATAAGARLLAHELAHVVQQERGGPPDLDAVSEASLPGPDHASEHAADAAAGAALEGRAAGDLAGSIAPGGAVVQRWPWDDEPAAGGGGGGGDSGGSLWDSVTGAVGGAATAVYDGYQSATDFKGAAADVGTLMDMMSESSDQGNQKMVEQAKGIPVLEQLAEGSAWINNISTQATSGAVKGAADVVGGVAHGLFHPIDAAGGMLGLLEHDSPLPFLGSTLKAGHGLWDLAVNDGGQYGNSLGEVANSVFNPLKQQQDDAAYNEALVTGILAPGDPDKGGGWQAWSDRPVEAGTRALMNVLPFLLGGEGETPPPIEAPPPTLRSPFAPPGVPAPPSFRPNIPSVRPGVVDPHVPTVPSPAFPPDIIPGPATQPSPGVLPPSTIPVPPTPTIPGLGPIELPPLTEPGIPSFPGLGPGRPTTIPGLGPIEIPPLTEPGMPTLPGVNPGRFPTIPGLNPPAPAFPPELLPEVPPSSGRPVPSSFPQVPSFPSSEFPAPPSSRGLGGLEPEVPSGRPTVQPNAGHEIDLAREQQLAEHNRLLEQQGLGQFPPAPAPFRTSSPFPFEPLRPEHF